MRSISRLLASLLITTLCLTVHAHIERDSEQTKTSFEKIKLNKQTVIIVRLDSEELNQLKEKDGEDNFYTAADDWNWYNSELLTKMDSLKIAVRQTDSDSILIETPDFIKTIVKDSTFSIFNYFFYDGEKIERKNIFNLLNK